jgi:hypothetical protein
MKRDLGLTRHVPRGGIADAVVIIAVFTSFGVGCGVAGVGVVWRVRLQ